MYRYLVRSLKSPYHEILNLRTKNLKHILLSFLTIQIFLGLIIFYRNDNTLKSIVQVLTVDDFQDGTILYQKLRYNTSSIWIDDYELNKDILTIKFGPQKGKKIGSINELSFYDSDPRLIWSVYLNHLMTMDETSNDPITIPFSWYDWADFHMFNKLMSVTASQKINISCNFLMEAAFNKTVLESIENQLNEPLFSYERKKYSDPFWYKNTRKLDHSLIGIQIPNHCVPNPNGNERFNLPYIITGLYDKLRPEVYELHARNHMLNSLRHPLSLTIMNKDKTSYRVDLDRDRKANIIQSNLLSEFIESKQTLGNKQLFFDHTFIFEDFISKPIVKKLEVKIEGIDKDIYDNDFIHLKQTDFEFDPFDKIKKLETNIENLNSHEKNYLESLKYSINTNPALSPKHFDEAKNVQQVNGMGFHRDKRFYNGALIDHEQEYMQRLNSLIRNFQKFIKANGLISWLSHGTLFGYLYNGQAFPWDNDFDLQMPIRHLHYLSEHFNQSLILEDPREGNGKFLLDVGSSLTIRTKGNGENNIDARFIDVDSGIYIDITGLSVSSEKVQDNMAPYIDIEKFNEVVLQNKTKFDSTFLEEEGEGLASLSITELQSYINEHEDEFDGTIKYKIGELIKGETERKTNSKFFVNNLSRKERYFLNRQFQLYNCKNRHFSTLEMLSPLITTSFHGVDALIPHKFITSLRTEYKLPEKFGFTTFQGNVYLPELRYWFKFPILKKAANINKIFDSLNSLTSSLNDIKLSDILIVYHNLLRIGSRDLFANLYTSFDVTTYRMKEIEIQYDDSLDAIEKLKYLSLLRKQVAPNLESPNKDPVIYDYEKRLWEEYGRHVSTSKITNVCDYVDVRYANMLWEKVESLQERRLDLFKVKDNRDDTIDLNNIGLNLFTGSDKMKNTFFKEDPSLHIV
ncbi:Mnn14p NDAI_0A04020 [Naumovozyma dairenensis CBS 421]|uniref:LicD/FKTN/FKRP nucleotidyltransferase domain-containing protein n=1 Tax=Naumovozyma dairenensis (strain ATCC 10597 / BCRC 20456 / CBS 421 / NBRC 0211 / NRRL Y-12639) TaxID=1071378 RepID=G0W421_NAUDC|nr:hypothetical protein NDAI_0A04020 [Naumovozyma dairenensis CBS 421]CCD22559.1 hypothetical protein NDAI_0A04020 [Naumovozyma dairenensis CBS 421]